MKFSKSAYLVMGLLFTIDFFFSLFDNASSHKLFFWDVNIWVYRSYRFLIAIVFIKLYIDGKKIDSEKLT